MSLYVSSLLRTNCIYRQNYLEFIYIYIYIYIYTKISRNLTHIHGEIMTISEIGNHSNTLIRINLGII